MLTLMHSDSSFLQQHLLLNVFDYFWRYLECFFLATGRSGLGKANILTTPLRSVQQVIVRLEYEVEDKSIRNEESAVNKLNVSETSWATEWWSYMISFDALTKRRLLGLTAMFPGIPAFVEEGRFKKPTRWSYWSFEDYDLGQGLHRRRTWIRKKTTFAVLVAIAVLYSFAADFFCKY